MKKQHSFPARITALLPMVALSIISGCAGDSVGVSDQSLLGTTSLGTPQFDASEAPASIAQKALSSRDAAEEAIIAYQHSDEFRDSGRRCGTPHPVLTEQTARDASD